MLKSHLPENPNNHNQVKPISLAIGALPFRVKAEKEKKEMFVNVLKRTRVRATIQGFQKTLQVYDVEIGLS